MASPAARPGPRGWSATASRRYPVRTATPNARVPLAPTGRHRRPAALRPVRDGGRAVRSSTQVVPSRDGRLQLDGSRQSRHGQSGADHQYVDHSAILTASANRHQAAPSGRTPDCQPRGGRALDSRELMVISERSQPPVRDFRGVRVVSSFRSLITKGVRKSPRPARITALVTNHSRNSAAPGSSTAGGGVLDS